MILVGLPGSGKSTVGALAAARLGAAFADVDRLIEARAGRTVAQLFAEAGEAAFRALEGEIGAELLALAPRVIAPGGGYVLDPARRRDALARGLLVYLETSPEVAARRLGDAPDRPLLAGQEPAARLRELLAQREAAYLEAPGRVTTDARAADDVAAAVAELARRQGGW